VTESGPRRCPVCGRPVSWSGFGRPPTYDRPSCRTRAWEARRAAATAGEDEHQAAADLTPVPAPAAATEPTSPATARQWAALLDTLAVELATGDLGRRHYDHRHLHAALQRVWVALDAAHPGGLDELQRRRR
jgi:hypothetical protein